MNNLQRRKELEAEILKFVKAPNSIAVSQYGGSLSEYMNLLAVDISSAIGPINPVVAPFIITHLENYADAIKSTYPGIQSSVDSLRRVQTQIIKVAVPHE